MHPIFTVERLNKGRHIGNKIKTLLLFVLSWLLVALIIVFYLLVWLLSQLKHLKHARKLPVKKSLRTSWVVFLWLFVVGTIFFLSYFIYLQRTLPEPDSIATRRVGQSTKIYDQTGEVLLYDIHGEEKRTVVPWEEISEYIKKATLASEDSDFYNHKGVDFKGILRAIIKNLISGEIAQGGSTITQQLIGNALVGRQVTIGRKVQELILAIEVEKRFTKDEIFWMYLNQIPYGSNAYGIEAASKTFFGKPARDLTLAEAATLASLPRGPTLYSPYGNNVEALMGRKEWVLGRMLDLGQVSQEEYDEALKQELVFKSSLESVSAPHFVIMVKEYLVSKYGESAVENSGMKVITTLNADFQKTAEESVSKYAAINKAKYGANNAALTAIDPTNGDIVTMVGSSDYFDLENEGNFNVALAKRQPGSAFKPFAYAEAFHKGFPDSTILFDTKTEFNPNCQPHGNSTKDNYGLDCYNPQNYDGRFRGPVSLRQSLAQSLNIPSVKTLYLAGIDDTINLAESMGITTLTDRNRYGLSLVLGGAEVRLVDMVSAYGVFANDGIRNSFRFIKKIELPNGVVLEESQPSPTRVLDSQTSRLVTDVMSDNNSRAPVFGFNNSLYIPGFNVAAKTGTTQENRDAWVMGYSSSLVVGVWVGNNDNKSMSQAGAGISAAGPLWNEVMRKSFDFYQPSNFNEPDPVFSDKIMLNGNHSSGDGPHSILFYVNKEDPLGPYPQNPYQDVQFNNWEWSVRNYYGYGF